MSDDQMQDANQVYTTQPSQEDGISPVISEATQTSKSPLPAYADPSFYSTLPTPPPYTPAPERPSSSTQRSYTYASSPRPQPARSSRPSSFWRMVRQFPRQYWRVLTKPAATTFYPEEGKATWGAVWTQLLGFAIINALVIIGTVLGTEFMEQQSTRFLPAVWTFLQGFLIFGLVIGVLTAIFTILGYFFNASVFYLFARLFGGRATFLEHCYCTALIVVPIWAISLALSTTLPLIPAFPSRLASIIGIVGFAYGAILQIFMIMAIHRLNWSRAAAAVVIAIIILLAGILPFVPIPQ